MLKFESFNKEESKIYYTNTSTEIIPIKIDFIDCYTNSLIHAISLNLQPNTTYWTLIHVVWKNTRVNFYDRRKKNLILPVIIDGDIDLSEIDVNGYLKNVQSQNNIYQQMGVHDVLKEHFHVRKYEDLVDVEDGDVVIDVGFNYGIFSLGALKKGASKIYAFEPNRSIIKKLDKYPKSNIVEINNIAISNKEGVVTFEEDYNTLGSKICDGEITCDVYYEVNTRSLNHFIETLNEKNIDFLKIDCEGEEYKIFEDLTDSTLSLINKLHVEFHQNSDGKVNQIIEKLERNNFNWWFESGVNHESNIGLIFAKKKKKKIALVSCYCDTDEKNTILEKNIKTIKSYGVDVALISPIQLPKHIIGIADYVFIDKENPVLDWPIHAMYHWKRYEINDHKYEISNTFKDYGWAGLLHVKKMAQIFKNYDYDYYFFTIYDIKLDDEIEKILNVGFNKKVFPSKRGDIVWQVGLHLMSFDKENLNNLIDKINYEDYLSYIDYDAFVYLHKHIVESLNIPIGKHQIEDQVYYHENKDNLNHSPDEEFKFFISCPDPQIDTLKIFFNGNQSNETITLEINNQTYIRQIHFGSLVDLGIYKHEMEKVVLIYRDKTIDLTQIIKDIKNSIIKKYD